MSTGGAALLAGDRRKMSTGGFRCACLGTLSICPLGGAALPAGDRRKMSTGGAALLAGDGRKMSTGGAALLAGDGRKMSTGGFAALALGHFRLSPGCPGLIWAKMALSLLSYSRGPSGEVLRTGWGGVS